MCVLLCVVNGCVVNGVLGSLLIKCGSCVHAAEECGSGPALSHERPRWILSILRGTLLVGEGGRDREARASHTRFASGRKQPGAVIYSLVPQTAVACRRPRRLQAPPLWLDQDRSPPERRPMNRISPFRRCRRPPKRLGKNQNHNHQVTPLWVVC